MKNITSNAYFLFLLVPLLYFVIIFPLLSLALIVIFVVLKLTATASVAPLILNIVITILFSIKLRQFAVRKLVAKDIYSLNTAAIIFSSFVLGSMINNLVRADYSDLVEHIVFIIIYLISFIQLKKVLKANL